jgi:hypothetical protein
MGLVSKSEITHIYVLTFEKHVWLPRSTQFIDPSLVHAVQMHRLHLMTVSKHILQV